ncbi:MAG: molybdenum cofactor biosynthesis protein MoaB [Aureliella sp.]
MNQPSSSAEHRSKAPDVLQFAVLTVSDTRTIGTDKSGLLIVELMRAAGHELVSRAIVPDEPVEIAERTKQALSSQVDVLLLTGGTGISHRDQTPEAIEPLIEVPIPGFGELFRMLSYEEIGAAAMLSRAFGGRVGSTLVFCLPGSTGAVRLAMEKLLVPELPHLVFHAR